MTGWESFSFSVIVVSLNEPYTMCNLQKTMLYTPNLASHTYLCNDLGNCAYKLHVYPTAPHSVVQSGESVNGNIPYEVTTGHWVDNAYKISWEYLDIVCERYYIATYLGMHRPWPLQYFWLHWHISSMNPSAKRTTLLVYWNISSVQYDHNVTVESKCGSPR